MVDAKINAKLLTRHIFKHDKKEDMLHSSGYAQVQNGANVGAASAESFAARQAINENRRYVQGYKNSRIMNEFYGVQRAREKAGYGRYGGRGREQLVSGTRDEAGGESALKNGAGPHPMDVAMRRAEFSSRGEQSAFGVRTRSPILENTRAPQVPNRRAGI